ncbi:MAG: HAD-IA family hydrolase, partial [Mariprofundaceae bacterium]
PRLILFDCDGTLMNSHLAIVMTMQQAFASCGLESPSDASVRAVIGLSLAHAVAELCEVEESRVGIEKTYRQCYRDNESQVSLYPGVIETLDALKAAGYWMGVVTGKSKSGLLRVLEEFQLSDYFLVLRTADCCPSKPHPAMALECMTELGVTAVQTTLVGDARFDIQMAQQAGIRALGVSFGVESAAALYGVGASHVVDNFSELLRYFSLDAV